MKRFVRLVSFFFSSCLTFVCVLASRKYHQELDKLHKLNSIFRNKNAKVVIGSEQGEKVAKKIMRDTL
jgi:hypothetical protein